MSLSGTLDLNPVRVESHSWYVAKENELLRAMLARRVCGGFLYTDDGELQDNTMSPFIDFKRDSAELIFKKLSERNYKAAKPESNHVLP